MGCGDMVLILYRLAAELVLWIARAGGPFWPARWRVAERVSPRSDREGGTRRAIWLHAASLGECKGSWALARALREGGVDADFVLTANTDTGFEFLRARTREAGDAALRAEIAPLDHPRVARRFLKAHGVRALIVFEVELWPFWFLAARRFRSAGVPVSWVSARWNARARRRYGMFPAAARRVLRLVSWTQAQSEEDANALRRAGCPRVAVGGDLRGLEYLKGRANDAGDPGLPPWPVRNGLAFVSFHAGELPALVPMLHDAPEDAPLIVFPRKPGDHDAFLAALAPLGFVAHSRNPRATRRVVDRFGLVSATLRDSRGAVVGGSFAGAESIGGHNLWEPLLAGCRVATGAHHANQAWLAERMRAAGSLRVLADGPEWKSGWADFLAECAAPPEKDRVIDEARTTLQEAVRTIREQLATQSGVG
jgi:3-deoxy-D-manno-octulosonic-acid transferase